MNKTYHFGKNITEVINVKEKLNQLFKDKLLLVMLVLGLLTIVAAAGVVTIQRGNAGEESPYLNLQDPEQGYIAGETTQEGSAMVAGESNAEITGETKVVLSAEEKAGGLSAGEINEPVAQVGVGQNDATALTLNFTDTSKISWPVRGNVVLDYSMDSTIYFPTLDQYKCNSALVIQGEVSMPVTAPANARIMEVGSNEEIGNYVVLDIGNEYAAVCGQLKEIQVVQGEYINKDQILGYVAEPTKYYSVEGTNVFFEMTYQDKAIDPLDFLE